MLRQRHANGIGKNQFEHWHKNSTTLLVDLFDASMIYADCIYVVVRTAHSLPLVQIVSGSLVSPVASYRAHLEYG